MSIFCHTEDRPPKIVSNLLPVSWQGQLLQRKIQGKHVSMFLINTRNSNPSLHPDKTCHECYCVIFTVIKKKSSVTTAIFKNQTERL